MQNNNYTKKDTNIFERQESENVKVKKDNKLNQTIIEIEKDESVIEHNIFEGDISVSKMQSFHLLHNESNMNSIIDDGSNRHIFQEDVLAKNEFFEIKQQTNIPQYQYQEISSLNEEEDLVKPVRKKSKLLRFQTQVEKKHSDDISQNKSQANQHYLNQHTIRKEHNKIKIEAANSNNIEENLSSKFPEGSICTFQQEQNKIPNYLPLQPNKKQDNNILDSKRGSKPVSPRKAENNFKQEKEMELIHQIGFRFEQSAKLHQESQNNGNYDSNENKEIILHIEQNIGIILNDPMILFYSLYYCVFYNNEELLKHIRDILSFYKFSNRRWKIRSKLTLPPYDQSIGEAKVKYSQQISKIDELVYKIDTQGMKVLIDRESPMCQEFLHTVFYQSIDDNIRFIYEQIFYELKELNLRDKDALHLIKYDNFKLIQESFSKKARGLFTGLFMHQKYSDQVFKKYKEYDRSYYLEIMIKNEVEQRIMNNFKLKFLNNIEDIDNILNLYCKLDDLENFVISVKETQISKQRIQELYLLCLKSDSFKILFHLHLNYQIKYDQEIINGFFVSLKDFPQWFFELKLFFLRYMFPIFNVAHFDELLTILDKIFNNGVPNHHPIINCYNPIKCSVLVYEICWKIKNQNVYSLQRKCDELTSYIIKSLELYLNEQQNISHLYRLMREPVLHPSERQDSMDLMLLMNMEKLIQHKVVEEVLNLVFDGKYSIDSSPFDISSLWVFINQMDTFSTKSCQEKLMIHVQTMGDWKMKKQFSIQFHIWKQCIRQREQDEMIFVGGASIIILITLIIATNYIGNQYAMQKRYFGNQIFGKIEIIDTLVYDVLLQFCKEELSISSSIYQTLYFFEYFIGIVSVSYVSQICSVILTSFAKQNMILDIYQLFFMLSTVFSGFYFIYIFQIKPQNHLSKRCLKVEPNLTQFEIDAYDYVYSLELSKNYIISFQIIISVIVAQHCFNIISLLKRTENIGPSIVMIQALRIDLIRFLMAFSLPFIMFLVVGTFNSGDLTNNLNAWTLFLQLFASLAGNNDFTQFTTYQGQLYLIIYVFVYFILLQNFLVAMFSNTYKAIQENKKSIPLKRILEIKNNLSFDAVIGAVSSTFFPINIFILPFMPLIVLVKNKNTNETFNKFQYTIMVSLYCVALVLFQIALFPIMLVKLVLNTFHIMINSQKQNFFDSYIYPFYIMAASPFVILLCIIVDFITLPKIFWKNEEQFEEKYQKNLDELSDVQLIGVNKVFFKILYSNYKLFKGKFVTYLELLCMHRSLFGIMENLNDLICKGTKDYRESLLKVQDFNFTKVMAKICSVPSKTGNVVENHIDFDMLKIIYQDVLYFNHVFDIYNGGKGIYGLFQKNNQVNMQSYKLPFIVNDKKFTKRFRSFDKNKGGLDLEGDDEVQNSYDQFMRDPYDLMNNFQTNKLCEAFTDISQQRLSKKEKTIENKISQLFTKVDELIHDEELDVIQKLNDKILHKKTNYMQQKLEQERCPISTSYFMSEILNQNKHSEQEYGKRSKRTNENKEITFEGHTMRI